MAITIEKLRRWMLLAAVLIVAGIAALLLVAAHERRKLLHDLPGQLGMDIQQQTNEFTYSQSVQGKTLFTLHAAKAVQMKSGGKIKLHDVTIILYGRKQDRADRIAGEEFDYDPASGIARAAGEVFLDLQAPTKAVQASTKSTAAADATKDLADAKGDAGVVHVTTRGLVFQQKQGIASTDQQIDFKFGSGVTGHAHGAQYDSSRGVITLNDSISADTAMHGRTVHVTAAHGELDRDSDLCTFTHAVYASQGQTLSAERAVVHMRTDGSTERIEATGDVTLALASGATVHTPHAVIALNDTSAPKDLQATGGVHFTDVSGTRNAQGDAAAAHVVFNAHGQAQRAELSGGVHTLDREKRANGWSERELQALSAEVAMQDNVMQSVTATGSAQMRWTAPAKQGMATSVLTADTLHAAFGAGARTPQSIHGEGHTVLKQTAATGAVSESSGDTLDVQLRPQVKHTKKDKRDDVKTELAQIERAVQQGNVTLTQTPASKGKTQQPVQPITATAERAEYAGVSDTLMLFGNAQADPQFIDGGMQVGAKQITVNHTTGNATLTGNVHGSYAGTGTQAPAHIVADHAQLNHDEQRALFYGAEKPARLWQEASQVEAHVLEYDRVAQKLTASGAANDAMAVHAAFAGTGKRGGVVRVAGRRMVYTTNNAKGKNGPRHAEFSGGVTVESADAVIKAQHAVVELAAAAAQPAAPALSGSVQRITANGQIVLTQGARQGFGEQLVYTPNPVEAANPPVTSANPNQAKQTGKFLLTGTTPAPPRLVDPAKGTLTGASLLFNSADDSVVVSGGAGAQGRVRTELKVDH